jgi:hypothetical protein
MRFFDFRRHLIGSFIFLLAVVHLVSAPLGFAKQKKHGGKRTHFPKAKICSTDRFGSDTDEESFEDEVNGYLGIPYRRGGSGANGIDCSGLSRKFYLELYGIDLPHNSGAQCKLNIFDKVPLNPNAFESRDLLFFQNKNKRINHVGIYLEDGKFLHASSTNGVMISSLDEPYWKKRLAASRRVKDTVLSKGFGSGFSDSRGNESQKANEIAIGYAADINESVHVGVETFYSGDFPGSDRKRNRGTNLFADGSMYLADLASDPWQGIRASTSIYPAEWLRITPSLGMLDGPQWYTGDDTLWQVYGLETAFSPISSRWSLVFSMQSLLNESYFTAYQDAKDTDIGLHFNYWVSDTMRFSVMGNWEGSYLTQDAQPDALARDILTFNLDFHF